MANILDLITKKVDALDSIPKKFLTNVEKSQYEILDKLIQLMGRLSLNKEGMIEMTAENLAIADEINAELGQVFLRSDYIQAVTDFASSFDLQKKLNDKYFQKVFPDFKKTDFAEAVFNASKQNAVEALATSTVTTNFLEPLRQTMDKIVTNGMSFKDAVKEVRQYAIGDGEQTGKLLQYSKQIAYDSIATADRAYTSAVAEDLGNDWFYYAGGLLKTSREFCIERHNQYYHFKEVESWAGLNWDGKMENTTPQNIWENLGGYNCNHAIIPVSIDQVPKSVLKRNINSGNYVPTEFDLQNVL